MKTSRVLSFIFSLSLLFFAQSIHASEGNEIHWMTNYEQAVAIAKSTSKPIVLFFTGTDWCGWCNKLENEILETPEFIEATKDKMIFVKLDFPMHTPLDSTMTKQNEQLQKQFSVRSFPTLVLLDSDQQPIGVTGYRAGGGKQYAHHLIKMVNEYTAYKQQMRHLGTHKFTGKELKRLYQKARELGLEDDVNILIRIGMDSDLAYFFLAERYRLLVSNGQIDNDETRALKQRIFDSDPENKHLTHYQVAVIEFEACCEKMEQADMTPDNAVSPLISYIEKFGREDTENLWRLNMIISQVYQDKNNLDNALKYAKDSYSSAPSSIQPDIAMAIMGIQKQIRGHN